MSYRAGTNRRDGRNSNYNSGGGGTPNRRQDYGNQMNPWQGGVVPGGGNQMGGLSSLLSAPIQPDFLSQLSTPEAQLAMATSLLNKILSPQQTARIQTQQPAAVPSLMSLPSIPMNRNMGYDGDYRSRPSDLYSRRPQPYNKVGFNRRPEGNRKPGKPRSDMSKDSPKSKKKDDKKIKYGDADDAKKRQDDDTELDGEGKKDGGDKEGNSSGGKKQHGAKYKGIPSPLLACHVCKKNMWDASSFEKHVSGRSHQMMMEQLDGSYKIKVELIRHEQRAAEALREMEVERLTRQGKKIFNHTREFCAMCDLHFCGNLMTHRKKELHQKLKSFLHPKCGLCDKEFPNRLEWDEHKLAPQHLMKVTDFIRERKPGIADDDILPRDLGIWEESGDVEFDVDISKETRKVNLENLIIPTVLPKYDPDTPVGIGVVTEVNGKLCKCCKRFIYGEEEYEAHCRSYTHYRKFAQLVKLKAKEEKEKERAAAAAAKKAAGAAVKAAGKGKDVEKPPSDDEEIEERLLKSDDEETDLKVKLETGDEVKLETGDEEKLETGVEEKMETGDEEI